MTSHLFLPNLLSYFSLYQRMAAFSYQHHHPLLLVSPFIANSPIKLPLPSHQVGEMTNVSPGFSYCNTPEAITEASETEARAFESSSSLDGLIIIPSGETQMDYSSSVLVETHGGEGATKPQGSTEKKRKNRYGASLSSSQSKDTKESKSRKHNSTEGEKPKADEVKEKKTFDEPPKGYIHVRARRGQATDSHSLAERVRREKISQRMKLLQGLVPGCDKISGKALIFDEIINYVQSLQNQVEFLSMKLAFLSPTTYDFGVDLNGRMDQQPRIGSMSRDSLPLPFVPQRNHIPPAAVEWDATKEDYPMMELSPLLPHRPGPQAFFQDNCSSLMQVGDQRQGFLNPMMNNNMCSFQ